jgi:hypothetical protein
MTHENQLSLHPFCQFAAVDAPLQPYDYRYDLYQAYYHHGIRAALKQIQAVFNDYSLSRFPRLLRSLRRVRHSFRLRRWLGGFQPFVERPIDHLASAMGGQQAPPACFFHPLVGQYVFRMADGRRTKVCIDAHDAGDFVSTQLLDWSDIYFKTNFWTMRDYPRKVLSLYNGNPLLLGHLHRLRALRNVEPSYDLCFVVRVWGGADEVSGIEHNLRLLEAVAKCDCRKFLMAYLVAGDVSKIARRLERQGIPCRRSPIKLSELWRISADSRLNIIRLGMHSCTPWRMTDLVAMGTCPVLDQPPKSKWPVSLQEGEHFLSLGATPGPDGWVASERQYEAIPGLLRVFLSDQEKLRQIRENNLRYFDCNLAPEAVGQYICDRVAEAS